MENERIYRGGSVWSYLSYHLSEIGITLETQRTSNTQRLIVSDSDFLMHKFAIKSLASSTNLITFE